MIKCENCESEHDGSYGSGRFCSSKCAKSFSTKAKRKEINRKVSNTLSQKAKYVDITCRFCDTKFTVRWKRRKQQYCSNSCATKDKWRNDDYKNNIVSKIRERCSYLSERKRLRDIGRQGGFGLKGYTKKGTYYSSLLEKACFEFLEQNDIPFTPHKNIPNSSKVSDVYLNKHDIWIELDGINRDKRQKWLSSQYKYWLEKLQIYDEQELRVEVIYNFEDFVEFINEL